MRNVLHINREPSIWYLCPMTTSGDLVVVPTEEMAETARKAIRALGAKCLRDVLAEDLTMNADQARNVSVEVRTLAEIEQMDANEKLAMEVW